MRCSMKLVVALSLLAWSQDAAADSITVKYTDNVTGYECDPPRESSTAKWSRSDPRSESSAGRRRRNGGVASDAAEIDTDGLGPFIPP